MRKSCEWVAESEFVSAVSGWRAEFCTSHAWQDRESRKVAEDSWTASEFVEWRRMCVSGLMGMEARTVSCGVSLFAKGWPFLERFLPQLASSVFQARSLYYVFLLGDV